MLSTVLSVLLSSGEPALTFTGTARQVTQAAGRWGGAAVSRDEEERLNAQNESAHKHPEPLAEVRFLVLAGKANVAKKPVAEFTTDKRGRFRVSLPPGSYCVIEASRALTSLEQAISGAQHVDQACMARLRAQCDVKWSLKPQSVVSFTLTKTNGEAPKCWVGPTPP